MLLRCYFNQWVCLIIVSLLLIIMHGESFLKKSAFLQTLSKLPTVFKQGEESHSKAILSLVLGFQQILPATS